MRIPRQNRDIILTYETGFAERLAAVVIQRPALSLWMILMPVFFVYYFLRLQKVTDSRKAFRSHYLIPRRQALEAVLVEMESGDHPTPEELAAKIDIPVAAKGEYGEWIQALMGYYADLLRGNGKDFADLVRSVYRSRTDYLLELNRLSRLENALNKALMPHIHQTPESVEEVVRLLETHSLRLRRDHAAAVFPPSGRSDFQEPDFD